MVASPTPDNLASRLADLQRQIDTLRTVAGNAGTSAVTWYPHSDGSPQRIPLMVDENNRFRIAVWDPSNPASRANQQVTIWDANNHAVFITDHNGGQAIPWYNVPLYPRFTPPQNATDTAGTVYAYATISTSAPAIAQGQLLWEGRLAYVSHPRLSLEGVWGQASGTVVPTFTVTVGGSTLATFTPTGALGARTFGPWDISSLLTETQVSIQVSVTWTGTGVIACDALGCYLRQT